MATHIALLRAVNLGSHNKVAMSDLRELMAKLDLMDGQSLLQSGNLIFDGNGNTTAQLERLFESEAEKRLGLKTDFFVRTAKEWKALVDANPFPTEAKLDPGHLIALVTKTSPERAAATELQKAIRGREVVKVVGRCAYIYYPDGVGQSRLTGALLDKKLGTSGTGRNWNTVLKLGALVMVALFATFAAPAAAQVKPPDVSVGVSKETALLAFADFSGVPVDLKPYSRAAVITDAQILFANRQGEISYVVVQVSGATLKNGGMRYCGAGEEANLIWIKASHAAILDVRSVLFGSCAFSIEPTTGLYPSQDMGRLRAEGKLNVEYESFNEKRTFVCTYDDAAPEKGLTVVSTKR